MNRMKRDIRESDIYILHVYMVIKFVQVYNVTFKNIIIDNNDYLHVGKDLQSSVPLQSNHDAETVRLNTGGRDRTRLV